MRMPNVNCIHYRHKDGRCVHPKRSKAMGVFTRMCPLERGDATCPINAQELYPRPPATPAPPMRPARANIIP